MEIHCKTPTTLNSVGRLSPRSASLSMTMAPARTQRNVAELKNASMMNRQPVSTSNSIEELKQKLRVTDAFPEDQGGDHQKREIENLVEKIEETLAKLHPAANASPAPNAVKTRVRFPDDGEGVHSIDDVRIPVKRSREVDNE
jgi:hypothetical protein